GRRDDEITSRFTLPAPHGKAAGASHGVRLLGGHRPLALSRVRRLYYAVAVPGVGSDQSCGGPDRRVAAAVRPAAAATRRRALHRFDARDTGAGRARVVVLCLA